MGDGIHDEGRKIVMTLGMANAMLLSLTTVSGAVAATPGSAPRLPAKGQSRKLPGAQPENVTVRQQGSCLLVDVQGRPGRHVAAFWGRNGNVDAFRPIRGASTVLDGKGRGRLKVDVGPIDLSKFYVGLGTAKNAAFTHDLRATEILEVQKGSRLGTKVEGLDHLRQGRQAAFGRTIPLDKTYPCKGGGGGKGGGGLGGLVRKGMGTGKGFLPAKRSQVATDGTPTPGPTKTIERKRVDRLFPTPSPEPVTKPRSRR